MQVVSCDASMKGSVTLWLVGSLHLSLVRLPVYATMPQGSLGWQNATTANHGRAGSSLQMRGLFPYKGPVLPSVGTLCSTNRKPQLTLHCKTFVA